nr:putative endothelial lipase [Spodoptera frugiperda]
MLKLCIFLAAAAVCYGQDTKYTLYTKAKGPIDMSGSGELIKEFGRKDNTIFLIHGYFDNSAQQFLELVRPAILKDFKKKINVIEVNWKSLAEKSYTIASGNVGIVAVNMSNFIRWLDLDKDVKLENFHLVGFDLGAHVAGIAGRNFNSNNKVGRITGLNPTGRHWGSGTQRLRDTDATYVEVIHTDTFGALSNGIEDPIGHVNFYPNGGRNQPGCVFHSCCHARSFELFAASINEDNRLRGNQCSSMTQMNLNLCRGVTLQLGGTDLSKTGTRGIYRINTTRRYPFY